MKELLYEMLNMSDAKLKTFVLPDGEVKAKWDALEAAKAMCKKCLETKDKSYYAYYAIAHRIGVKLNAHKTALKALAIHRQQYVEQFKIYAA